MPARMPQRDHPRGCINSCVKCMPQQMYAATVGADPRVRPEDRRVTTHVDVFGRAHRPSPTVNALRHIRVLIGVTGGLALGPYQMGRAVETRLINRDDVSFVEQARYLIRCGFKAFRPARIA